MGVGGAGCFRGFTPWLADGRVRKSHLPHRCPVCTLLPRWGGRSSKAVVAEPALGHSACPELGAEAEDMGAPLWGACAYCCPRNKAAISS